MTSLYIPIKLPLWRKFWKFRIVFFSQCKNFFFGRFLTIKPVFSHGGGLGLCSGAIELRRVDFDISLTFTLYIPNRKARLRSIVCFLSFMTRSVTFKLEDETVPGLIRCLTLDKIRIWGWNISRYMIHVFYMWYLLQNRNHLHLGGYFESINCKKISMRNFFLLTFLW